MKIINASLKFLGKPLIFDSGPRHKSSKNGAQRHLTKGMGFVLSLSGLKGGAV